MDRDESGAMAAAAAAKVLYGAGTVAAPQSAWRDSPFCQKFWRRYLGQVPFDTVAEIARGAILEQRQR